MRGYSTVAITEKRNKGPCLRLDSGSRTIECEIIWVLLSYQSQVFRRQHKRHHKVTQAEEGDIIEETRDYLARPFMSQFRPMDYLPAKCVP